MARESAAARGDGSRIEGRRAVSEALKAKQPVEKILIEDNCHDGALESIRRDAKKRDVRLLYVSRARLDQLSETGRHQGVIAYVAAMPYAEIEDIFSRAAERNEKPFIFLLDSVEDPHNLGAVIRTANVCGAHGVIIPKNRAAHLTAAVARTSAGAVSHTPVVRVTNLTDTIRKLQEERGVWFVCADMDGAPMYDLDLTGPIGLVIGNEGTGVGTRIKKQCDMIASIPVRGEIESLNASVAAGVLAYEIVRQRMRGA